MIEKIRQRAYEYLRARSVYQRLKIVSVLIGTASLVLITAISIMVNIHFTMELLEERESRYLAMYVASVSSELEKISEDLSALTSSGVVQSLLEENLAMDDSTLLSQQLVLTREAEKYLAIHDVVKDVYLFTTVTSPTNLFRGPHSDMDTQSLDTISLFYDTDFFSEKGAFLVDAADFSKDPEQNQKGLICLQRVLEERSARTRGYLMLYLDKAELFERLVDVETSGDDICRVILNPKVGLVHSSERQLSSRAMEEILTKIDQNAGSFSIQYPGSLVGQICVYSKIGALDLYAVTVIPASVVSRETYLILGAMLVLLALLTWIDSVTSKHIAKSISIPVEQMLQSLREIRQENFSVGPFDAHTDELAEVNNFLNDTKIRLSNLIGAIKETEQQKYKLQLEVLRTQINPHFLVNTLNSTIWLAQLQGADNIQTLVSSLIDILRPCMRNTSGVATIGDEIKLLRDYSTIMEFQYMNQFELDIDVEAEVEEYLAPVLFLQPLVENALIHGRSENALLIRIWVRAHRDGDSIHILVQDDGKGMSPARLREIQNQRSEGKKGQTLTSIGVSNIRQRMDLLYREKPHSMTITSQENQGTTVEIRLPMIRGMEDHHEENTAG